MAVFLADGHQAGHFVLGDGDGVNPCAPHSASEQEVVARKHGIGNMEYRLGDLEDVPIRTGTVDLAFLSQALHHARHPAARRGGSAPHSQAGRTRSRCWI
jgi:hypothetical protein